MSAENVDLARRWFEDVWNKRQDALIDELVHPQGTSHANGIDIVGPADFRRMVYQPFLQAFPDLHVTIQRVLSEKDVVAVLWTATGTHTGDGLGFPASGRPIRVQGSSWIRFENGQMKEGWDCWNYRELFESLR